MTEHATVVFVGALFLWGMGMVTDVSAAGRYDYTAHHAEAEALLAKMTPAEKVGQMCQPDQQFLRDPADIERLFLGSLLSGGGSGPKDKAKYNLAGWTDMVDGYHQHALRTRLRIPLLYGVDAVHGHHNIPGAVVFPHNIGLGCARNADLVERIARATAEEVRATGINWVFGPCVAVPLDERWGRTYEGYSEDPAIVRELGAAVVRGFQGGRPDGPLSVVACAKHYVGDGGTGYGTAKGGDGRKLDQGDMVCDEATLRRVHLPGYIDAIAQGVATIMPSYSSWNGAKCTGHRYLLTDLLKEELGFDGFLISDYNAIDQLDSDYRTCIKLAINAGIDMVMLTDKYARFCEELTALVEAGEVPMSRIDDAVIRILRVKIAAGLMADGYSPLADRSLHAAFGSAERRMLARGAVRESLVLLKNDGDLLPLRKAAGRIHVAGPGADSVGMLCGGWTIDWQGSVDHAIPGGTSLLAAVRQAVSADTEVTFSADGSGAAGADVAVVVIGEKPYAEFMGDSETLTLAPEQLAALGAVKAAGVPTVVVLISGRPVMLDGVLDPADALVAAWLPGSEGQGVTDVLFGDHAPTGRLSFVWPRSVEQIPMAIGDPDALFPIGYGLTY
jgi:beta-glucosidase